MLRALKSTSREAHAFPDYKVKFFHFGSSSKLLGTWLIGKPRPLKAGYIYPNPKPNHYGSRSSAKSKEILAKKLFEPNQLRNKIRRLIVDEGQTIREVCATLGHTQKTVRGICRTLKIGPYAEITQGQLRACFSQIPYGWALERELLQPSPPEMKWIKFMKRLQGQGASLHAIARALNEKRVPTKNRGQWHAKTVLKVLKFNEKGRKKK